MSEVHIDIAYDAFMAAEQDGSQRDAIRAALATQDALIFQLAHQIERLQHFEQIHISNLDMYRAQIAEKDLLIRELVAALDRIAKGAMYIEDFTASTSAVIWAKYALVKAKAAGFEP